MKRKLFFVFTSFMAIGLFLSTCKRELNGKIREKEPEVPKDYPALGNKHLKVFENIPVVYHPYDKTKNQGLKDFEEEADGNIIKLINGRVILKKVELPKYTRNVTLELTIKLVSAGDLYDRSGSCFILPCNDEINMIEVLKNLKEYPFADEKIKDFPGIAAGPNYKPAVEALRFMTPFGIGYYNNNVPAPAHVGKWEDYVEWKADISHLYSLFENGAYVGIWIDTWTPKGFKVDAAIEAKESTENKAGIKKHVEPLLNTIPYARQKYPDVFAKVKEDGIKTKVTIPQNAKKVKLLYTPTGHGGHSNGDEFVKCKNIINCDTKTIKEFTPWNNKCKEFRKWNPYSAVWGNTASSDLSRSNWCPGSAVKPTEIEIDDSIRGQHSFTFSIPTAQPIKKDENNFWLVSAMLVWEE